MAHLQISNITNYTRIEACAFAIIYVNISMRFHCSCMDVIVKRKLYLNLFLHCLLFIQQYSILILFEYVCLL